MITRCGSPAFDRLFTRCLRRYVETERGVKVTRIKMLAEGQYDIYTRDVMFEEGGVIPLRLSESLIETIRIHVLDALSPSKDVRVLDGSEKAVQRAVRVIRDIEEFDFPWDRSREDWEKEMRADADRERKISEAIVRFNRSLGQFHRYDYSDAGYPSDYTFKTRADDRVAMYTAYHRMVPVGAGKFRNADFIANVPMCLQIEAVVRGF